MRAVFLILFSTFLMAGATPRTPTQDGVVYGTADGQTLTMDYYAPAGPGPHPAVVLIHGGGYRSRARAHCGTAKP